MRLAANYDGGAELTSVGDDLRGTVLSLHGAMNAAKERMGEGDDDGG